MPSRTIRTLSRGVAVLTVLSLGACGSSGGDAKTSTSSSSGSGTTAAQKVVTPLLKAPTTIGLSDKLSKLPPKGAKVVFITCQLPTCTDFSNGFKSAAEQFSWEVDSLTADSSDPSSDQKQMAQAVALKPDAIVITGGNVSGWKQGLDAAKAADIPVFGTSMEAYPLGESTGLYASIPVNTQDRGAAATAIANWMVVDSKAKADVVTISVPELAVPYANYTSVTASVLKAACPDTCSSDTLTTPYADVAGGKLPGAIVSYLQTHPKVNYVNLPGGIEPGVAPALKAAGLASKVKIVNASSSAAVEASVKSGELAVAWGFPALMIGWYVANAIARNLVGDDAGDSAKASLPGQLLTADNVTKPENFLQPSDYEDQFRALWGIS